MLAVVVEVVVRVAVGAGVGVGAPGAVLARVLVLSGDQLQEQWRQ